MQHRIREEKLPFDLEQRSSSTATALGWRWLWYLQARRDPSPCAHLPPRARAVGQGPCTALPAEWGEHPARQQTWENILSTGEAASCQWPLGGPGPSVASGGEVHPELAQRAASL